MDKTPLLSEPFNDHTPLPWRRSKFAVNVITDELTNDGSHPDIAQFQRYKCSQDVVFVLQCVNTYYEREAHRLKQEARIAELEGALGDLIERIEWCHDDADFKAPEQFTKQYVYSRYLNTLLRHARIAIATLTSKVTHDSTP